jgi:hypothetical protein
MTLLDQGPILVVGHGPTDDIVRHVHVRYMLADRIATGEPYKALLASWRDPEVKALAADAHNAFEHYIAETGYPRNEVAFVAGRLVGRAVQRRHALDEPAPPQDRTVQVGAFVDQLLAGDATLGDLEALLTSVDKMPEGAIHLDLRSPRPLGTATRFVEIANDDRLRDLRAPLETLLAAIDGVWGDAARRRDEAVDLLDTVGLGAWPVLATDLVHRYGAEVVGLIRGETARWEYRMGDPSLGGPEPAGLEIAEFVPTGNAATDRRRLKAWKGRLAEVEAAVEIAARAGGRAQRRTRPIRPDELDGYRRDVRWLYENLAEGKSLTTIAGEDLDSRDRWRDVQRSKSRIQRLLAAGRDYEPGEELDWSR